MDSKPSEASPVVQVQTQWKMSSSAGDLTYTATPTVSLQPIQVLPQVRNVNALDCSFKNVFDFLLINFF